MKNISRRTLLQFAAGGLVTTAVVGVTGSLGARNLQRPPGALVEAEFIARCSRCLRCLDVCQPAAIRPAHWLDGTGNLGTPILETAKCIRCMECVRICPTGALSKIPKVEANIGGIAINQEVCTAWNGSRRCDRCFRSCRMKAITMKDRRYPILDPEKCDSCGVCILRCPEKGAIFIDPSTAKRHDPQPGRIITALEDRVGPYEVPPPTYAEWFTNRIRVLARAYGLIE